MTLKSSVIMAKKLPAGSSVSYGRLFVTSRDSKIATIPIGYADGYSRRLTGRAEALIHGCRVPVVGRITMDTCMLDTTGLEGLEAKVGDEVVLFGEQNAGGRLTAIPADELACWLETINYEVTCMIGRRVPRVYLNDGELSHVSNYLLPEGSGSEITAIVQGS
jgi:alanine racemase